jgi:imidazolonepropionase-like amidohydrolase
VTGALLTAATVAFRGATLIDGTGAPPQADTLLVVSNGRIASVGRSTPEALAALPPGADVIDVSGNWILPGLIDAHVHAESDEDLKTMLNWGVTSVRLMAEDVAAAQKLATESRTRTDIPEVFPAAPIFATKGGWWDQGEPPDENLNRFPATPGEARAAVREAKRVGSSEIKLMLDDMAWCRAPRPALPKLPPRIVRALVSEARGAGLRVSVHAPNRGDAREAIAADATALARGVLDPLDEETIAVMKRRPVYYLPTMGIFEYLADTRGFVDLVLSDPRAAEGLAPATVSRYRSRSYSDGYRERYANFENVKRHLPALRENLRRLHKAGVPVALGTDMWAFPGLGVSIEMGLYVGMGLTPLEAIRAATQTAARSLGIETDRGTLEPGKRADVLILDADPLADPKNVRSLIAVHKAGQRVSGSPPIARSPDRPIAR